MGPISDGMLVLQYLRDACFLSSWSVLRALTEHVEERDAFHENVGMDTSLTGSATH